MAGRATLIKATLQAIPTYTMQCFKLPSSVINNISSTSARFLSAGTAEHRKLHMISLKRCCNRKENGGLGFKNLKLQNQALLSKLGWQDKWRLESRNHGSPRKSTSIVPLPLIIFLLMLLLLLPPFGPFWPLPSLT